MLSRVLDLDRDYAIGAVYGLVLLAAVALSPLLPSALALTGPVVCPDGQPDTIVTTALVESDDHTGGGVRSTGTGVSLFCMGERGDATEVGLLRPIGVLAGGAALAVVALATLWWALRRGFRRLFRRR